MAERRVRKDAVRNREAVLAAADSLFADSGDLEGVTMAAVAEAAGVGKGTVFRAFGDRRALLQALYEARLEPLADAVETGPPPLGPGAPADERVPALLDALVCFKLDNRKLVSALEDGGPAASPYAAAHYEQWHASLRAMLDEIPGVPDGDFAAHALLATIRADLIEHLAGQAGISRHEIRAQVARFAARIVRP
jgi:AcrR family transcriptional regulator